MASPTNGKTYTTQQSVNQAIWSVCDILRRSGRSSALQYIPELTWILFLRILDERETQESRMAAIMGTPFTPSLSHPYRWQDWAAPSAPLRQQLQSGRTHALRDFLEGQLFPHIHSFREQPGATPRQKIVSQIMRNITRFNLASEYDMWEVIDRLHGIHEETVDTTHVFPLSQVFEGLLLRMGEKNNDGGQFFTPREIIRLMVQVLNPQIGQTIYDPSCGTGGFHAQSYEYLLPHAHTPDDIQTLKQRTFYGWEKDDLIYPIALANLILHGIDTPSLAHGNTLTGQLTFGDFFKSAPAQYDNILTNPPFGGKESKQAQTHFAYKTSATQVLFLQHILDKLAPGGQCGIVLDEGVLFRTNEKAFLKTKTKLLNEYNLWGIVSLPGGVFTAAGAGVKANILFFKRQGKTENIWYYDLSHIKVGKRTPFTLAHFDHFFQVLPTLADSDHSWTINIRQRQAAAAKEAKTLIQQAQDKRRQVSQLTDLTAIKTLADEANDLEKRAQAVQDAVYDLKAVNPNAQTTQDTRTPADLIALIESKATEIAAALTLLKSS